MIDPVKFYWQLCLASVVMWSNSSAQSLELSGYTAFESRSFPGSPLLAEQFSHSSVSLSLQPEFYYELPNGNHELIFVPYLRLDQYNGNRTHFDIREMFWQYYSGIWEVSVGFRKVFWGVTESLHLVDVINQTEKSGISTGLSAGFKLSAFSMSGCRIFRGPAGNLYLYLTQMKTEVSS